MESIKTSAGVIRPGDTIRIIRMDSSATPSAAFPNGVDHQAESYNGAVGTVSHIDDEGQIFGSWGGLGVQPWRDVIQKVEDMKESDK